MVDDAFEQLISHKARLIKNSKKYKEHLSHLFTDLKIKNSEEAAIIGAIDAMIYDMACAADFTKRKGKVNDWSSYALRKSLLKKIWNT
jgi:hypothetical protein